jgi:hypothetical protein
LNWHPRWRSDTAVEKTMNWYKEVFDDIGALEVCRKQIEEYFG